MTLPAELICEILREIIDTPAVFIFDVSIGWLADRHQHLRYDHMTFKPFIHPIDPKAYMYYLPRPQKYPGTLESQVSKTIRSLLLTSKEIRAECLRRLQGITVPTANGPAIVRFNPRKHIICLRNVNKSAPSIRPDRGSSIGPRELATLATQLTDINFEIHHLGFMQEFYNGGIDVRKHFKNTFPTIRHLYTVVTEAPRKNPSEPIDVVFPADDPAQTISPVFLHMAKRSWTIIRNIIFHDYSRGSSGHVPEQDFVIEGLVLI